ncbi:UNVERIFIED_CONTAM: hypothetical protein Slati_3043500 [Sesamum latifolium]|uniref:Uncharacterized protein n=1 Tax=Sesamum latifolium TaxID=2727402 RepID=A0AAW2UYE5_9LAMI
MVLPSTVSRPWSRAWNWASVLILDQASMLNYVRSCCAELLDKGTSYPIRATTVATPSPSITYLQAHRRDLCHVMTGDGSSSWNSPFSLHTPTEPDKAYDDHIRNTVISRTNPGYTHRVHMTVVIPQV